MWSELSDEERWVEIYETARRVVSGDTDPYEGAWDIHFDSIRLEAGYERLEAFTNLSDEWESVAAGRMAGACAEVERRIVVAARALLRE